MDVNDYNALRKLAAGVVDGLLAGKVPAYIDRDELIGECIAQLPSLLAEYQGRNGASLETFLKRAWRSDALNFIDKERRRHTHLAPHPLLSTGARDSGEEDTGSFQDRAELALQRNSDTWHSAEAFRRGLKSDVFSRARLLLTPDQFEALRWCYYAGMTERMAAEKLGITREAVASRLRKAVRKIREDFDNNPHKKRECSIQLDE
jgi:RNA polymerase sigma factor (sigma-70 family)